MTKIRKLKKTKLCRSYGVDLWGNNKSNRNFRPGQHGVSAQRRLSDFGMQLNAKQKLKFYYGRVSERQLSNYYKEAMRMRGDSSENLVGLLERRLATVVYRLNFASSIYGAHQLVSHKKIKVNGQKVNIASYLVKPGDVIEVDSSLHENIHVVGALSAMQNDVPDYIELDAKAFKGTFIRVPKLADIPYACAMEPHLVIEYYSR